jgi:hypothetical protein
MPTPPSVDPARQPINEREHFSISKAFAVAGMPPC